MRILMVEDEKYMAEAGLDTNIKQASNARRNLKKELLSTSLSWRVFIKGLIFLRVRKFDLNIRLYHNDGSITNHSRTVILKYTEERDKNP